MCVQVEVGPGSFQKIKLLGRGDVGKVYLVREKKSEKLFAMKGEAAGGEDSEADAARSALEEGDDRAQEDQAGARGAGDPGDGEPPVHRYALPLVPVGRVSLLLHGVLHGRGVLPGAADAAGQVPGRGRRAVLRGRGDGGAGVPAPDGVYIPGSEAGE